MDKVFSLVIILITNRITQYDILAKMEAAEMKNY